MPQFSPTVRVRNAAELALELVQRDYPEYHPLTALARMAHDPAVREDPRIELEVHKAILPYVAPKLANVEVKTQADDDRRVIVSLFETRQLEDGTSVPIEIPLITECEDLVPLGDVT